jgi:hypothetical protein
MRSTAIRAGGIEILTKSKGEAVLHDKPDTLEFGYVGDGIAGNGNEVRKFPRLDWRPP